MTFKHTIIQGVKQQQKFVEFHESTLFVIFGVAYHFLSIGYHNNIDI